MAVLGLRCYVRASYGCGEQGTTLGCSAWASHWCGLSCGAQALYTGFSSWPLGLSSCGSLAQWLWSMGLTVPLRVVSSWIRDQTCVPCVGRWILYLWTTREVLADVFLSLWLSQQDACSWPGPRPGQSEPSVPLLPWFIQGWVCGPHHSSVPGSVPGPAAVVTGPVRSRLPPGVWPYLWYSHPVCPLRLPSASFHPQSPADFVNSPTWVPCPQENKKLNSHSPYTLDITFQIS